MLLHFLADFGLGVQQSTSFGFDLLPAVELRVPLAYSHGVVCALSALPSVGLWGQSGVGEDQLRSRARCGFSVDLSHNFGGWPAERHLAVL